MMDLCGARPLLINAMHKLLVPQDNDQAVANALDELHLAFGHTTHTYDIEDGYAVKCWKSIAPILNGEGTFLEKAQAMSWVEKQTFANAVFGLYSISGD